MWVQFVNRSSFVDTLRGMFHGEAGNASTTKDWSSLSRFREEIALVWPDEPTTSRFLPTAIVTQSRQKRDLLAWVVTYVPSLRPITRVCRVIESDSLSSILSRRPSGIHFPSISAAFGLIVTEAIVRRTASQTRGVLTYRDCLETCSYAMARGAYIGVTSEELDLIHSRWERVQSDSRRIQHSTGEVDAVLNAWGVLASSSDAPWTRRQHMLTSPLAAKLVAEVAQLGKGSPKTIESLAGAVGLPERLLDLASAGTRESRVLAMENAITALATSSPKLSRSEGALPSLVAGYIVSQMSPGTLEYLSLLTRLSTQMPSIALWYGLFAGIHPQSSVLEYEQGLGWSVASDIVARFDLVDRPRVDFDFDEYGMLTPSDRPMTAHKWVRPGSLTVELIPGVETLVGVVPNRTERPIEQSELFDEQNVSKDAVKILRDVDGALRQLQYARTQLERLAARDRTTKAKTTGKRRR